VEDLRQAVASHVLIASIREKLNDIQKQIALVSQALVDAGSSAGPEEIKQFKGQLEHVARDIDALRAISQAPNMEKQVTAFRTVYGELSKSWLIFYENFGVHNATAITELGLRGDPLSEELLKRMLPRLQQTEDRRVEEASQNFYSVAQVADRIIAGLFLISGIVAAVIAYFLSRYLTRALGDLKLGAAMIGSGNFDHRIQTRYRDEVGDLANAFNDMSGQLTTARTQVIEASKELESRHREVVKQRQISDSLLLNILPAQIADELRNRGEVEPKYFEDVTILFTDFVGFSLSTENLAAEDLVHLLNKYFTAFDLITQRYGLEKLKTIGDSYMCGGGFPVRTPSHSVDTVLAAFEMLKTVEDFAAKEGPHWAVRIGINTGPVIAGVVGVQKFAFDVWGPTVNHASRAESSGYRNRINISESTFLKVKDFFECEHRGKVRTKERDADMFFVNRVLPSLMNGPGTPPPAFVQRYRIYFQKEPPAFPCAAQQDSTLDRLRA